MSKSFDVIVIGGGPGGYIAAIRAAQLGKNVACIDEWKNAAGGPAPGGTCTNVGCIPSKALLQSSEHFEHATHHFAEHGISTGTVKMDVAKMVARKDTVVKQNNDGILYLFKKNKVSFFHGRGSFAGKAEGGYEIKVAGKTEETLVGKQVIVATGSNARALPGVKKVLIASGFQNTAGEGVTTPTFTRLWDSTKALICKTDSGMGTLESPVLRFANTIQWSEEAAANQADDELGLFFESYRHEKTRGEVMRGRTDYAIKAMHANTAGIITGC